MKTTTPPVHLEKVTLKTQLPLSALDTVGIFTLVRFFFRFKMVRVQTYTHTHTHIDV